MPDSLREKCQKYGVISGPKFTHTLISHKNKNEVTIPFLTITHTPVFNEKNPKKVYKETTYTFFHDTFKTKKNFLKNRQPSNLGCLKK